jgi:pyruvate ferredoxin oxidoreductase gamma subunit
MAFCRIAREPIRMRDPISAPDALIIQDATLLHQPDLFAGLRRDGYVLINSPQPAESLLPVDLVRGLATDHLKSVPATEMALQRVGRPVPNTVLLGGFAALTGVVSLDSVLRAIGERFGGAVAEANRAAASDAYEYVRQHQEAYASAPAD